MSWKKELTEILALTQMFFLEKREWPQQAAELQAFAVDLGRPLDFSGFHRLRFERVSSEELNLDYGLAPNRLGFTPRGRATLKTHTAESMALSETPLKITLRKLPAEKVETRSYCSIWEPAGSFK